MSDLFDRVDFNSPASVNRIFDADILQTDDVMEFICEAIDPHSSVKSVIYEMCIIVEELFVNIAKYAYTNGGKVEVRRVCENSTLYVLLSDTGIPFDPLLMKKPQTPDTIDDTTVGGLGIFMARQYSDDMSYRRFDGKNELVFCKQLKEDKRK